MKLSLVIVFVFCALSSFGNTDLVSKQFKEKVELHRSAVFIGNYLSEASYSQILERQLTGVGMEIMQKQNALNHSLLQTILSDNVMVPYFLDLLEDTVSIWDVDKLAFSDLLDELNEISSKWPDHKKRIHDDYVALVQIRSLYNEEMINAFSRIGTRAMPVRRKMWDEYIAFLKQEYHIKSIIEKYKSVIDGLKDISSDTRSGSSVIWGTSLPAKTVVLTFDDGPHGKYTPLALEMLKRKNVPAIFFQLANNIASINEKGECVLRNAAKYSKEIIESPLFLIGSHTVSHPLLTKLDSSSMVEEIYGGFSVIENCLFEKTNLFRPPYGAYNKAIIDVLAKHNSKPFMWNIDSRDWADPIPASIANRVIQESEKQGKGIILMHDIHKKSIESLEMIIDSLRSRGFEFVLWDGTAIVETGTKELVGRGIQSIEPANKNSKIYNEKWALVIGVNNYPDWPVLQFAVNDANGIKQLLIDKMEYKPENIFLLTDEQASRKNIWRVLGDVLTNNDKVSEDDAVFIFFAGHGMTRRINGNKSLGYIIPYDSDNSSFISQAISMSEINDINEMIPAKHVLWVMDACYSGLALTRSGAASTLDSKRYLSEVSNRVARQIITAGGYNEEVADGGPNGHSIFTWSLINALSGDADINGDGFITASEIFNYVPPYVSSLSKQTPAYGNMLGNTGGDFVFQLKIEESELNKTTDQHDDATSALLNQIAELKEQLAKMEVKLFASQSKEMLAESDMNAMPDTIITVDELNSLGLKAYRQKDYEKALDFFKRAVGINPKAVQPINNMGFVYYKIGKYSEAKEWIERALSISPNRLVAYLNLADVQLAMGDTSQAIVNYQTYLSMAKPTEFTDELKEIISNLQTEKEFGK